MSTIETYTEITLDLLNKDSVSVLTRMYTDLNGVKTQIGENERTAYGNSQVGREQITQKLPEDYVQAILAVWGDTPTLEDPVNPVMASI